MTNFVVRSLSMLLLACAAAHVQASPFQNGSFELPNIAPSNFQTINAPGQAPTGWLAGGNLAGTALFIERTGAFSGVVAQDGNHLIGFGGSGGTGASIEQAFDTVAGVSYTVSFFTTAQQLGNGPQSFSAQAFSTAGAQPLLGSLAASIPVVNSWANHMFSFVADGSVSVLRFTDTSDGVAASSINWALDNVTVSGVPEPGTWALLLAGLAGLSLRARKNKR